MTRSFSHPGVRTLVDLMRLRAERQGEQPAFLRVNADGDVTAARSFAEVVVRAGRIAAGLRGRFAAGDRLLLTDADPLDFLDAYFGSVAAGMIPVPAPPPTSTAARLRVEAQAADCGAVGVLGREALALLRANAEALPLPALFLAWSDLVASATSGPESPLGTPDQIAFLQYTSGSTSAPRGAVVTHDTLLANQIMIADAFSHDDSTIFASWLPLFHDMGLVGGALQPFYLGVPCYLMSPSQFLVRPAGWLRTISRYSVTTSGGPDFAYALCCDRVSDRDLKGVDLRTWRVAFNGSEPIRSRTLARFADRFADHGFDRRAFYPCYGMAEATLLVTGSTPGRGPLLLAHDGDQLADAAAVPGTDDRNVPVACGRPVSGTTIRIVDPKTGEQVPEEHEGEIWISGPSVIERYWSGHGPEPDGTSRLGGRLAGDERLYLRSGDIGRLKDGELIIAGRIKDLIFVGGRNFHASDIEAAAATVDLPWRARASAAISIEENGVEAAALLVEATKQYEEHFPQVARALRATVLERCGLHLATVAFVLAEHLPTTTSGKLRRAECRHRFERGGFASIVVHSSRARGGARSAADDPTSILDTVRRFVAERMRRPIEEIAVDAPFVDFGMDSMDAAALAARLVTLGPAAARSTVEITSAPSLVALVALDRDVAGVDASQPRGVCRPATPEQLASLAHAWPERTADNLSLAFVTDDRLDGVAVAAAFETIAGRHAALRTAYPVREGAIRTIVADHVIVRLNRSAPADEVELRNTIETAVTRPFDIGAAPLWRVGLHDLPSGGSALHWVTHHAIVDYSASLVLLEELACLLDGRPLPPVTTLPTAAPAIAVAIGGRTRTDLSRPLSEVPTWGLPPSPFAEQPSGRALTWNWDVETSQGLVELARRLHVTSTAVVLTLFQSAIALLTGVPEVAIAVAVDTRDARQRAAVGCFVEARPVTTAFESGLRFGEAVARVAAGLAAVMHGGAELVVERYANSREGDPRFGFSALGGGEMALLGLPGASGVVRLGARCVRPIFPWRYDLGPEMLLTTAVHDGRFHASLQYDAARVSSQTAEAVLERMVGAARLLVVSPEAAAETVSTVLGAGAARSIAVGPDPDASPRDLFEWFDRHLQTDLDAVAVETAEGPWLRRDLAAAIGDLVSFLVDDGIEVGDRIAIVAPISAESLALVLATWQLGAVVCPVDPCYPEARRRDILADLDPRLIVDDPATLLMQVRRRGENAAPNTAQAAGLKPSLLATTAAYIIFTSGSTGHPKGVEVSRGALVNTISAQTIFDVGKGVRVLQTSSPGFDASIFEICLALAHGATLVLPPDTARQGGDIRATLIATQPDYLVVPPSLLASAGPDVPSPRVVVLAGEACPLALAREWEPRCRLFNAYGPTEAAIWSTIEPIVQAATEPFIGHPIPGTAAMVVDAELSPLPVGAVGEIVLTGRGLALGYLGDPERTRVRFPVLKNGARGYRTGDRGCMAPDGRLRWLGRLDREVKIRGVRIALDEVERCLLDLDGVAGAVVLRTAHPDGGARLGAVVVPAAGQVLTAGDLRARLAERLPLAMIPASFRIVEALPINQHGKADLAAVERLLEPIDHVADFGAIADLVASFGIVDVCREVFGREPKSVDDDLYALGGHSLNLVRFVTRLSERNGRACPVRLAIDNPRIVDFVRHFGALPMEDPAREPCVTSEPAAGFPLSPVQRDLWYAANAGEHTRSSPFLVPLAFEIAGQLDRARLKRAIAACVARHRGLRARVVTRAGDLRQIFDPPGSVQLKQIAYTHTDGNQQAAAQDIFSAAVADAAADPSGATIRFLLFEAQEDLAFLLVIARHVFIDGWSLGIVLADIAEAYADVAALEPEEDRLPTVLALEQNDRANGRHAERLAAWRAALASLDAIEPFIADAAVDVSQGVVVRKIAVEGEVFAALAQRATAAGASLFALAGAAIARVVSRFRGCSEAVLAVVSADRNDPLRSGVVGCLAKPLPVRLAAGQWSTVEEAITATRCAIRSAEEWAGPSISEIGATVLPGGVGRRNPLASVLVSQSDPGFYALRLAGTRCRTLDWRSVECRADLSFEVDIRDNGLWVRLEADASIFSPERTERVAASLREVLADWADLTHVDLDLEEGLSRAERAVIAGFDRTGRAWGETRSVPRIIEDTAALRPEAPALVFRDEWLSYADFETATNRLANLLLSRGIQRRAVIAVCCNPGIDMVIAIHAIMRAGAAWLPIDPDWPIERCVNIASEAGAVLVIGDGLAESWCGARWGVPLAVRHPDGDARSPGIEIAPQDPAYVLYTSGSTGRPKGAINLHRGLLNRLLWMQEELRLEPGERVVQKTAFTFDVSVWEFFWPLMVGATLVIEPKEARLDPVARRRLLREQRITTAHFVPSGLAQFLASNAGGRLEDLQRIILSGEALSADLVCAARAVCDAEIFNLYGPTEASIDVTFWRCSDGGTGAIPLGHAVANTEIHLLDSSGARVPIGTPGEIYIAGDQVGAGYVGRPNLTAARFLPDRFRGSGTMYRTGDIAFRDANGVLHYLGRNDDQAKIHGVRVEPEEIAAVLRLVPGVRAAAVVITGLGFAGQILAFVVLDAESSARPDPREFLAERLPAVMLPRRTIVVNEIPLLSSGKLDRAALIAMADRTALGRPQRLRTATEEAVRALWVELLEHENFGPEDGFFEAGGNSALIVRMHTLIEARFGRTIQIAELIEKATVRALAAHLDAGSGKAPAPIVDRPTPTAEARRRLAELRRRRQAER